MSFDSLIISETAINSTGVTSQPDTLTGSADENKGVFDALPRLIISSLNGLISQLQQQEAAEQLGVTPFTGMTATNLQDALEAIQFNLTQAIAGVGTDLAETTGAASVGFASTEQITAATVQAAIEAVQQHIDSFKTQMTGSGGAAGVGTAPISGLDATNVQAALEELRDDIENIVSGIIPGGSIATNMLQNGAVTTEKLADGSVTGDKLDVTGEDIPTSTTDPTSLSSQLSNAVPRNGDVIRNGITGATLGGGCASIVGNGNGAYLEAFTSLDTYNAARSQLILNLPGDYGPSATLSQTTDGQQWKTRALVTATPPQEQNLVLSPGWSVADNSMSTFYKTQESIVHVILNAITNSPVAEGDTIATLPVTYRPNKLFRVPIIYRLVGSGTLAVGHLDVEAYGAIRIHNCTTDAGVAEMYVNPFAFPAAIEEG